MWFSIRLLYNTGVESWPPARLAHLPALTLSRSWAMALWTAWTTGSDGIRGAPTGAPWAATFTSSEESTCAASKHGPLKSPSKFDNPFYDDPLLLTLFDDPFLVVRFRESPMLISSKWPIRSIASFEINGEGRLQCNSDLLLFIDWLVLQFYSWFPVTKLRSITFFLLIS